MNEVPGWRAILVIAGFVLLIMLAPVFAGLGLALFDGSAATEEVTVFRGAEVVPATLAWSLAIGAVAVPLAMIPASRLVAWAREGRGLMLAAWLVPMFLPPALFFDAWWMEVGPDSWIGRVAGETGRVPLLRRSVLALGLLGVAVPLAAWIHAAARGGGPDVDRILVLQDRPDVRSQVRSLVRRQWRAMLVSWLATSAIVAGLTVPFDLAQVRTWGFELRTLDTQGASAGTLLRVGSPGIVVASIASFAMIRIGGFGGMATTRRVTFLPRGSGRASAIVAVITWLILVGGPLSMLVRRSLDQDLATTWALHTAAAKGTLVLAIGGGILGAVVAVGFAALRAGSGSGLHRRWVWIVPLLGLVAFMPATLVAVGVESIWRWPVLDPVADGPVPTILAVAARIAIVPAIIGAMLGTPVGNLPRLDSPRGFREGWRAARPRLNAAVLAGGVVGGTLAAGEIPVAARVRPPGFPTLTGTLLDAMHYQYADSVLPVVVVFLVAATFAAVLIVRLSSSPSSRHMMPLVLAFATLVPFGCERERGSSERDPVEHRVAFGRPGNIDGRFDYPRAIALDEARGRIYVVDKSARVQRFSLDGRLETWWRMPAFENGKPTGIAVDDLGRVLVADTHEHRVAIFSPDGDLLETHGGLGMDPGEFVYLTDVAKGPDGTWFVSEYGGNDRVQIFNRDWEPIGAIGAFGEAVYEKDGEILLSRPQSLCWDDAAGELFIADAVNHRIVVTDAVGNRLRTLGGPGIEPGRLSYPYDLAVEPEGTLLVVEFGNNRIQRLDARDGGSLGCWGGTGVEPGRLRYPWGLDAGKDTMVVLDSGNSRVLVGDRP